MLSPQQPQQSKPLLRSYPLQSSPPTTAFSFDRPPLPPCPKHTHHHLWPHLAGQVGRAEWAKSWAMLNLRVRRVRGVVALANALLQLIKSNREHREMQEPNTDSTSAFLGTKHKTKSAFRYRRQGWAQKLSQTLHFYKPCKSDHKDSFTSPFLDTRILNRHLKKTKLRNSPKLIFSVIQPGALRKLEIYKKRKSIQNADSYTSNSIITVQEKHTLWPP